MQEDNDPTGYKSSLGKQAKKQVKIRTMDMPKRSPDLNVLDYRLWSHIGQRMRKQEKAWPKSFTETRAQYKERLRKTALSTPRRVVEKAVMDMERRCQKLWAAQGHYFKEW